MSNAAGATAIAFSSATFASSVLPSCPSAGARNRVGLPPLRERPDRIIRRSDGVLLSQWEITADRAPSGGQRGRGGNPRRRQEGRYWLLYMNIIDFLVTLNVT
jgi:hypothetical protein